MAIIKAIDPSKLPAVTPYLLQALGDAILTKGVGLSNVFAAVGYKKPTLPSYLLTWVAGNLATLVQFPCAPNIKGVLMDRTQAVYKRVFLAFYCLNLVQTPTVDAAKALDAGRRMAKALGLVKTAGHTAVDPDATWLGRPLPPAGNLRNQMLAATDGFVTM